MAKRSKRYVEAAKLVENKAYSIADAAALLKKIGKPTESIEFVARLGIDPKKGDQQVRGTIVLPNGSGKTKKIVAFVEGADVAIAKEAGADMVGSEELIAEIVKSEKLGFDLAVATPSMMPKLAKLARILGPKGLMPNPKTDTVSANVKKMIEELKRGKVTFKNDDTGNVHILVGKVGLDSAKLIENITATTEAIKRAKPSSSKGVFLMTTIVKSTFGPAIKIAA
ncbi:MAG: 50S ribosomal protein L1 [bacterium]